MVGAFTHYERPGRGLSHAGGCLLGPPGLL